METLLDIAKRLGIKPNPDMTMEEYRNIRKMIYKDLKGKDPEGGCSLRYVIYNFLKRRLIVIGIGINLIRMLIM